jgi:hypothetical protein
MTMPQTHIPGIEYQQTVRSAKATFLLLNRSEKIASNGFAYAQLHASITFHNKWSN